jgi:hypothetical protein
MIMNIQKYSLVLLTAGLLLGACKKNILQIPNPNAPTPGPSLITEGGIDAYAEGIYEKWIANEPGDGNLNFFQLQWSIESNMGDEDFSPYSNWGGRYPANVNHITLPAPYNTVVPNPTGLDQLNMLRSVNSRVAGDGNSIQYGWDVFYFMNTQANGLLNALDNPALVLSGDAATKKKLLQAWAYYWKGYCYSKLGSMYIAALINDGPDSSAKGLTSNVYVDHNTVIANANSNFEKAAAIFAGIVQNGDYNTTFQAIVPTFNLNTQVITPAMWIRQIHTFEARNFLANHKVATMTPADWTTVQTLASTGLIKGDLTLMWGMAPLGVNDLSLGSTYHPFEMHNQRVALSFISERLLQDYQPGDHRFTKNYQLYPPGGAIVNLLSRGIQFGTRYQVSYIENGGTYATNNYLGYVPIAPTWEENTLMTAEAKIRSGSDIEGGLGMIDQVRDADSAYLPHIAGTGLTQPQAIEQLRSERRVGLYQRNVAWYDARRWGVTAPPSQGGGRANANVLVPGTLIGPAGTPATLLPCFMDYSFVDYWDVPQNELDFNPAATGSAKIAN